MQYRIESDGWGDLTLWRYDSPHDLEPTAIATRHAMRDDEQWQLMVRGAGLDTATVPVSRSDLEQIVEVFSVDDPGCDPDNHAALRLRDQLNGEEVRQ